MRNSKIFNKILTKNKLKLAWREIEDQLIVFHIPTQDIYKMNAIGLCIWNYIDDQRTLADIILKLQNEFNAVPKSKLEKDAVEFAEKLIEYDIIEAK